METLPHHASVVVIGGGIMGCSTLYHLAEMGISDSILLERNELTSGTTWHSAAQVRALRSSRNLTRMIQYSVELYSRLEQETGQSVGWIQKGSLSIATTPDRLAHIQRQEALAHAYGVNARSIPVGEAAERWPLMNTDDVIGAVWSPDDGRVSPSDVCAALIRSARRRGARIFEHTAVSEIVTDQGRVVAVETTAGRIRCEAVALCAGLWSRELGKAAGADVPVLACEHFYLLTRPVDGITGNVPTLGDHDGHLYIRDDSGGLLVGCFEPAGKPIVPGKLDESFAFGLLPEDWEHFEPMMQNALHRLPVLETAEVRMLLNGPESFTPDGMFMLGETTETRGLFLGCGMNSVGMASGGGAGMNLAHCIVHGRMAYDLSEADARRFAPQFNSLAHLMARAPEILGAHYEISYPGRQRKTARNLRLLALDGLHRAHAAAFGQFDGWERPLYFGTTPEHDNLTFGRPPWFDSVGNEVMAAHRQAAVFDVSTLGKIDVLGSDAERFLQNLCAADMARSPGHVIYTAVLNARGNYESDLTALRIAVDHYRLYVGTTALRHDLSWLQLHRGDYDVTLLDTTQEFAVLALTGPQAADIAESLGGAALNELAYFRHTVVDIAGRSARAARMSYVGEYGWELTLDNADAETVYSALLGAGAVPAGLYAQTSMRIEKGFAAFGHELDSDISPIESGLDKLVKRRQPFLGAAALAERRLRATRSLVTVVFDDDGAVPLAHEPVYHQGAIIGHTTSAAYGYRIGRPLALAHVRTDTADVDGLAVELAITGRRYSAHLQYAPAFDPYGVRMQPA